MHKKILLITTEKELIEDIQIASIIETDRNFQINCLEYADGMEEAVNAENPDVVVITCDALKKQEEWDISVPVIFCARTQKELSEGAAYGFKTVGTFSDATELIERLHEEPYYIQGSEKKKKALEKKPEPEITAAEEEEEDDLASLMEGETQSPSKPAYQQRTKKDPPVKKPQPAPVMADEEELDVLEEDDFEDPEDVFLEETPIPDVHETQGTASPPEKEDVIASGFEMDLNGDGGVAKVVTVYSAKGGVGKTTIASELAMYLSLVDMGRRKLRVCIVDYNIDFGDVKSTLGMDKTSKSLSYWADEIRERLANGERPEQIVYTTEQIEEYLAQSDKSDLWVLPAPVSNEDSMAVNSEELQIILDNLKKHGKFDIIVCDTGNNTRDSTMIALENADMILLIMTQNINTANCDVSFMKTMETIDFDLSNARLVINNILPKKLTSIGVDEIESYFPFQCVGKLHYNPDVVRATNEGNPLALDPNHEFTKQMREIVAYILGDESFSEDEEPKKKGLFGMLFGRKKKKG